MVMISFLALGFIASNFRGAPVLADDGTAQISDQQAEQIRLACKPAQSLLQRLQTTDVATRVNRGQIYENLINRLISPFDNRVSLNHYDASALSSAATAISQKFTQFKSDYVSYSDDFARLLSYNCQANPRGFYSLLVTTRNDRSSVSTDINDLKTAIDHYTSTFNTFKSSIGGH